ncbi:MAG: rluA [Chlamydiales bacterium]|jgi:tRNA pseudouridine32 synthase/23S rRNA pseudouridine746 synthase/23S rRNA pseudouridine1911/1915/1917 synthase|nr:rluA [Chlamydiales bacterium]
MKFTAKKDGPLLEVLLAEFPLSSKTSLRSWIEQGRIAIGNQKSLRGDAFIAQGTEIELIKKPRFLSHPKARESNLAIVYQDAHLIAIIKPAGLLSVSAEFTKTSAHSLLQEEFPEKEIHVVHRLDQGTSGVMLFALSEEGRDGLKDLFEKHDLKRIYVGVVQGKPEPAEGTWQCWVKEASNYTVYSVPEGQGAHAITHYKTLSSNRRYSLMQFQLETGRKNQIRVHCQLAKTPIVGDKKYGANKDPLKRLALHAKELYLAHPITGKPMHFKAPIPDSFLELI